MTRHLLLLIFTLIFITAYGQVDPDDDRLVVLRHNKIGKTYVFDRSKNGDYNRT